MGGFGQYVNRKETCQGPQPLQAPSTHQSFDQDLENRYGDTISGARTARGVTISVPTPEVDLSARPRNYRGHPLPSWARTLIACFQGSRKDRGMSIQPAQRQSCTGTGEQAKRTSSGWLLRLQGTAPSG